MNIDLTDDDYEEEDDDPSPPHPYDPYSLLHKSAHPCRVLTLKQILNHHNHPFNVNFIRFYVKSPNEVRKRALLIALKTFTNDNRFIKIYTKSELE